MNCSFFDDELISTHLDDQVTKKIVMMQKITVSFQEFFLIPVFTSRTSKNSRFFLFVLSFRCFQDFWKFMESADKQDYQFGRPVREKENSLTKPTISSRNTSVGKLQRSQNEHRDTFREPVCMFRRGNVTKIIIFSLTFYLFSSTMGSAFPHLSQIRCYPKKLSPNMHIGKSKIIFLLFKTF
jgi:hypothetical protein